MKSSDPTYMPTNSTLTETDVQSPEFFEVEGEPRQSLGEIFINTKVLSNRLTVKKARVKGNEYLTEISRKKMSDRHSLGPRCDTTYCSRKGFGCELVSSESREKIHQAYYDLTSLKEQCNCLARHLTLSQRMYAFRTLVCVIIVRRPCDHGDEITHVQVVSMKDPRPRVE